MARLNEGLSFFDAILIVPMFQIAWTFFSICTGFVYFQEYQVCSFSSVYGRACASPRFFALSKMNVKNEKRIDSENKLLDCFLKYVGV